MTVYLADDVQRGYTHVAGLHKWALEKNLVRIYPFNRHLPGRAFANAH